MAVLIRTRRPPPWLRYGTLAAVESEVGVGVGGSALLASTDVLVTDATTLALTGADADITFRHLVNMVGGYAIQSAVPGSQFAYNDYAAQLLARALAQVFAGLYGSGTDTLADAFAALVSTPIGMQDGSVVIDRNESDGGFKEGLDVSPRDWARLGLLWLLRGLWGATRVIPDAWFDDFTTLGVPEGTPVSEWTPGDPDDYLGIGSYGGVENAAAGSGGPEQFGWFLWLNLTRADATRPFPSAPTDTYRVDGHFGGEILVVIPSLGIVAAWVGGTFDSTATDDPGNEGEGSPLDNILEFLVDAVTGSPSYAMEVPGASWTTATDAAAGFSTAGLNSFVAAAGSNGFLSRNGRQVRTWGSATTRADVASAGKGSVLSTLLGLAVHGIP